jgi:hypothetical protein
MMFGMWKDVREVGVIPATDEPGTPMARCTGETR